MQVLDFIEEQTLFDRNLALLEELDHDIAEKVRALGVPSSAVVGSLEEGDLNIDLGHTRFYAEGAMRYCERQVDNFIKKPHRIKLSWAQRTSSHELANHRVAMRGLDYLDENKIERVDEMDADAGYLIVLGVGLGLQIQPLLDRLDVRNLVLVEQHPEFLYHALEASDWSQWKETIEERGGEVRVILAENQFLAANDLYVYVRRHNFGLIDGSYILLHYQSSFMRGTMDELISRVPVIAANPGFFEDEIVMLRNCFRNLQRHEHRLLQDKVRLRLSCPVIVVASGPSTDTAIDFVRDNADKAIIITCGTGLSALLGYGLKPDFHVDTENTEGPLEIVTGLTAAHDLSGITLVACNTVDPRLTALFEERMLYFRDSVSGTQFFGRNFNPLMLAAPTVANAAVRTMLGLGFREVYLVGVDLGSRDPERHHSQKSIYVADEEFLKTHPEHAAQTKYPISRSGNFGGVVFANSSFLYANMFLSNLLSAFPTASVYNLSDGARIVGTIPRLARTVDLKGTAELKQRDLSLLRDSLDVGASYPGLRAEDLNELRAEMKSALQTQAAFFRHERDLHTLFDSLEQTLSDLEQDAVRRTVMSFIKGTTFMLFQFVFVTIRRLPQEARPGFLEAACEICAEEMEGLQKQFDELIDMLISELDEG